MAGCVRHHRVHLGKRVNTVLIPVRYLELRPATQSVGGETQMRNNSGMLILLLMVLSLLGTTPRCLWRTHARAFLANLVAGRQAECVPEDSGDDRIGGGKGNRSAKETCYAAGQDLGLAMV